MSEVFINVDHPRGGYAARVLRERAAAFLQQLEVSGLELSVLVTTDEEIRRLNRDFRGKDTATDVLSFPAGEALPGEPPRLGDLAISLDTAKRRAGEEGRPLSEELARYLAHGLLHLLGYDHETSEADAAVMAEKEAALLGKKGMLSDL